MASLVGFLQRILQRTTRFIVDVPGEMADPLRYPAPICVFTPVFTPSNRRTCVTGPSVGWCKHVTLNTFVRFSALFILIRLVR